MADQGKMKGKVLIQRARSAIFEGFTPTSGQMLCSKTRENPILSQGRVP